MSFIKPEQFIAACDKPVSFNFILIPSGAGSAPNHQTTRPLMKYNLNKFIAVLFGMGSTLAQLQAQTAARGDLMLFFQKPGDTDTVYVNLGNAATLYRGAAIGPTAAKQALNIININSSLTSAFGAGWASDPDVYAGLAGVYENSTAATVVNGDQYRTLYVSKARTSVGTVGASGSTAYNLLAAGSLNAGALAMYGMTTNFITQLPSVAQGLVTTEFSVIDNQNPTTLAGVQTTAFGQFVSGVQQRGSVSVFGTFGLAGQVEFALDLQRLVPDGTVDSGEIAGTSRTGSYEGTVTVGTDGNVSFITQGTSAYDAWLAGFPLLATPTDKLPATDFDNDGVTNLVEFVLNGNPAVSGASILPTLDSSGANFVFNFTRRADSTTEVTQVFEYSTDLVDWTTNSPITIPTTPGTVGFATVEASTGTAPNLVQAVTLTIPKGSNTKLFGRLKAVK
jgi:hypothetical protein